MHFFQSVLSLGLLATAPLVSAQIGGQCDPVVSQPNPIAKQYTKQTTGTLNSTIVVLPITYKLARSIVPSQYPILKNQYAAWLPSLGKKKYPAILEMALAHDIYKKGESAGSSGDYLRAQISFPFVDRLNDGYTAMMYSTEVIVSSSNSAIQSALGTLGYQVSPGYFSTCNAYEYENGTDSQPPAKRGVDQAAWANTNTDLSNPDIAYRMVPTSSWPYSVQFFYNVTNQPLFSGGKTCDYQARLFNTDVSESPYGYTKVSGDAAILSPFFTPKSKTVWSGAYGMKMDSAFHEATNVACSSLKGTHVISAS